MGSKSQRNKLKEMKARRRRQEKRQAIAPGGNLHHQQRLLRQAPQGWTGEAPEDVAVFDDAALQLLPPDLGIQVAAVRAALEDALESRGDDALQRTTSIPRSSPVSQWRLFIRGLVAWLAEDFLAASDSWRRLDFQRRPGRIAIAMMAALRTDLEKTPRPLENTRTQDESATPWSGRLSPRLLYHAKLLRRTRFDRVALRTAQAGLSVPEESKKLHLGPRKIRWLKNFIAEHAATEPDLTAALSQVALARAYAQNFSDVYEDAIQSFKGPRHDPRNLLLTFHYFARFAKDSAAQKRAQRALDEYLNNQLPQNKELPEPLRAAIASQIHLNEAMELAAPPMLGMLDLLYGKRDDPQAIRKHFRAAVKAYPGHRAAYQAHVDWIESHLDNYRLTKPQREPWEKELARVMQEWSSGLPDDAAPRLWLVDYLLEHECIEEAKPHVDWMSAARHDNPRVRATPWKWQLLEASRLCRRKTWLTQVPERLAEAERLWPEWLSRQWLAYWKVAWTLRTGESGAFHERWRRISEEGGPARDSLADACMMLGAAQWMRVPTPDVKLLREPVDRAVKNLDQLPLEELLAAGAFFWDLHRTQLLYPAYRMHGTKLAKELFARLTRSPNVVLQRANDAGVQAAVLWCSEHRFSGSGYELKLPSWYSAAPIRQQPLFAAAKVNAFLKLSYHWGAEDYRELGSLLRESAPLQRDTYYRHWFLSLAQELDDVLARTASRGVGLESRFFGADGPFDVDNDEDYADALDFDPDCDCPHCQAAQRAYAARNPSHRDVGRKARP